MSIVDTTWRPTPAADLAALFGALAEVAAEIENPSKTSKARIPTKQGGAFEFKYAPLDAIIAQTRPLLARHGLCVIQYPVDVGTRAGVSTWIVHSKGGAFDCGIVSLAVGDDPKALGAAITYLRRYAYCAALNIAADEDADATALPDEVRSKTTGGGASALPTSARVPSSSSGSSSGGAAGEKAATERGRTTRPASTEVTTGAPSPGDPSEPAGGAPFGEGGTTPAGKDRCQHPDTSPLKLDGSALPAGKVRCLTCGVVKKEAA